MGSPRMIMGAIELTGEKLSAATSQEGERWPVPTTGTNAGEFRPLVGGTPADFAYSGTTTGNGAGDGSTTIDSVLAAFGDDYFIGATLAITSGACSGESKTITDFAQATGTLTHTVFTAQIASGVTFTLTVPFSTRDFQVVLDASGDAGDATFKWSHDGGVTFFGRDDPYQAAYPGTIGVFTGTVLANCSFAQLTDGTWIGAYSTGSGYAIKSSDGGITWGTPIVFDGAQAPTQVKLLLLSTGRLIIFYRAANRGGAGLHYFKYSDDDGATWSSSSLAVGYSQGFTWQSFYGFDVIELQDGRLAFVYDSSSDAAIYYSVSADGGLTWSSLVNVITAANDQQAPCLVQTSDGLLVCIFETDQDSVGDFELKCCVSSDGGATWGAVVDVVDFGAADLISPRIAKDINGDILCVYTQDGVDIRATRSTNGGTTWGASIQVLNSAVTFPDIAILDGHISLITYLDGSQDIQSIRRGFWEAYSANGCPCAMNAVPQSLICGAEITWLGGSGVIADSWTFEAAYTFGAANLLDEASPQVPWRSEADGSAMSIVFDMGANGAALVDAVGVFGTNIYTMDVQANATDSWGAPSLTKTLSFVYLTDAIASVTGNMVACSGSAVSGAEDHSLAGMYAILDFGGTQEYYWILDNIGVWLVLDTSGGAITATTPDVVKVCKTAWAGALAGTWAPYRFVRISIPAIDTPDGYFQIGTAILGRISTFTRAWTREYPQEVSAGIAFQETQGGALNPIKTRKSRRSWELSWRAINAAEQEVVGFYNFLNSENAARPLVLIPDVDDYGECYLARIAGDMKKKHVCSGRWDVAVGLVEVI